MDKWECMSGKRSTNVSQWTKLITLRSDWNSKQLFEVVFVSIDPLLAPSIFASAAGDDWWSRSRRRWGSQWAGVSADHEENQLVLRRRVHTVTSFVASCWLSSVSTGSLGKQPEFHKHCELLNSSFSLCRSQRHLLTSQPILQCCTQQKNVRPGGWNDSLKKGVLFLHRMRVENGVLNFHTEK